MFNKMDLAGRLKEGSIRLTLPIIEQRIWSDATRGLVMKELNKFIIGQINTSDSRRPARVWQDKIDMARALLASIHRALDRKQFSRRALHGLLMSLLANNVTSLQSEEVRTAMQRFAQRHGGQAPPLLMVISPTSACNLRCSGCYASSGPTGEGLQWEVFDRIITEAKLLWGMRFFTISGGEPLAYRSQGRDLLDMAAKHHDCAFLVYTNGTLIDDRAATRMAEVGNVSPGISVEGLKARTDERRGPGVFQRLLAAMARLRQAGVPFGISVTATRYNAEEIFSDAFIDFFFDEQQAIFGWLFQYMPIGRGYTLDLLPTPEQRLWMWRRTWQIIRERQIMLVDFWNCATVSQGCIAAGQDRGYLYVDWDGKVMPCVFVPYAAANIHSIYARGGSLDDVYDLPYFRAIRQWQLDYGLGKERPAEHGNWLLPCSLRDHYAMGRGLIEKYHPEPEDKAAAEALEDRHLYEGMVRYDEELHRLFEPVWEKEYLKNREP